MFFYDCIERAIKTGIQVFAGLFIAAPIQTSLSEKVSIVAISIASSFLTSVLSSIKGNPDSASLLQDKTFNELFEKKEENTDESYSVLGQKIEDNEKEEKQ